MYTQRAAKAILALLFAVCVCCAHAGDAISKSAGRVRGATVAIQVKYVEYPEYLTVGTGWLHAHQDTVVTAKHVVTASPDEPKVHSYRVQFLDGRRADIESIVVHDFFDVAVINLEDADVSGAKRPLLKFAARSAVVGEEVFTIGHPMSEDGYLFHLTTGRVTNDNELGLLTNSAEAKGGNSGGALCNENGEVTGMVVSRDRRDNLFNFAVALEILKAYVPSMCNVAKKKGAVATPGG